MKKLLFALAVLFTVLCFAGAGYVLCTGANAGYAVIPMLAALVCMQAYRSYRKAP